MYSKNHRNYYRECRKKYRRVSPLSRVLTILAIIAVIALAIFVGIKVFGAKTTATETAQPETIKNTENNNISTVIAETISFANTNQPGMVA